jgi:hypothetical protein
MDRRTFLQAAAAAALGLWSREARAGGGAPEGGPMQVTLHGHDTRVVLASESSGIRELVVGEGIEIPFLFPPLTCEHFFTGAWPPPKDEVGFEPLYAGGVVKRTSPTRATWHQPTTSYSRIETTIHYEIADRGTVEARIEARSHAASYPLGYVGLFWAMMAPPGGQRGIHLLMPAGRGKAEWRYFQGGGDSWAARANGVLGPAMATPARAQGHPARYYLTETPDRFALPIQVGRWRDLYYSLEVDSPDVAFADVLLGTAIGGASWDLYWCLRPGESRSLRCRVTVGPWSGWKAIEDRYRAWEGCLDPKFAVTPLSSKTQQPFAVPHVEALPADSGLALSEKLFQAQGRALLQRLKLLDRCSVGCFGGTSQNAGLDDAQSRDHVWGPYLTFLLQEKDWPEHGPRLKQALEGMPDRVDGVEWRGYEGPLPRKTDVHEIGAFLRVLTGMGARPETNREWLPHVSAAGFLGRRRTERLFDAGQGKVFHDPGMQFTDLWRHWTGYVPPDIHRALLARSLFRVWNAGPEYNLARARARGDAPAFALAAARFAEEVLELAFCWNERFVPQAKWRVAHLRRLPICPTAVRDGLEALTVAPAEEQMKAAADIVHSVKLLMKDLYHVPTGLGQPLCFFAHAAHAQIEDEVVKQQTELEWW